MNFIHYRSLPAWSSYYELGSDSWNMPYKQTHSPWTLKFWVWTIVFCHFMHKCQNFKPIRDMLSLPYIRSFHFWQLWSLFCWLKMQWNTLYHLHNDAVTVRYKWSLIISLISVLFEIWIYQATPQVSFLWWLQCRIKRKTIWEKPCLG